MKFRGAGTRFSGVLACPGALPDSALTSGFRRPLAAESRTIPETMGVRKSIGAALGSHFRRPLDQGAGVLIEVSGL
jgi:hypothetical protein